MNKNESKARKLIFYLKNGGERRTMAQTSVLSLM